MRKKNILGLILFITAFPIFMYTLPLAPEYFKVLAGAIVLTIFTYRLYRINKDYKNQKKPIIHWFVFLGMIVLGLLSVLLAGYFLWTAPLYLKGTVIGTVILLAATRLLPEEHAGEELPVSTKQYVKQYTVPLLILLFFFVSFLYSDNPSLMKKQGAVLIGFLVIYRAYNIYKGGRK
ncbi:MAG: hypothetical protein ACOCTT_01305 [archaeon]